MVTPISLRWLGVAGIELRTDGQTLLIDPLITRFPFWKTLIGRIRPDREHIAELIPRADVVLVTHAHWDHLMDVPEVMRNTDATALGSSHTCRLLNELGIPVDRVREIEASDVLTLGDCRVEVLPAEHMTFLKQPILNGPLPSDLRPPLRAMDYRMDRYFSFLIEIDGYRLLDWCSERSEPASQADVFCIRPYQGRRYYEALLRKVQPQTIIPIHWDDFFRPLDEPIRPMLKPPCSAWPPLQRVDLARFKRMMEDIAPQTSVVIPERFRVYDVRQLAQAPA